MHRVWQRITAVAIAAALVFSFVVPIPVGIKYIDHSRFGQAEAIAPAIPLGAAAALLVGSGVIIGGTTLAAYETNLGDVAEDFINYVGANLYHDDIDAAVAAFNAAVNSDGNLDVSSLAAAGWLGLFPDFAAGLVDGGTAAVGDTSIGTVGDDLTLCGYQLQTATLPSNCRWSYGDTWAAYTTQYQNSGWYKVFHPGTDLYSTSALKMTFSNGTLSLSGYNGGAMTVTYDSSGGRQSQSTLNSSSSMYSDVDYWCFNPNYAGDIYVYDGGLVAQRVDGVWTQVAEGSVSVGTAAAAVVAQSLLDGTVGVSDDAVLEPFEPTAEQLEAGYTMADVVAVTGTISATLTDVLSSVNGMSSLLSPLAGIAANVQQIRTWWDSVVEQPFEWAQDWINADLEFIDLIGEWVNAAPISQWWGTLSGWWTGLNDWIGDTPFGDVMGQVIDGVQAIPGAVSTGATAVLEGVQAIPGSIAGVIEAVQAGVIELVGAVEGITFPHWRWPDYTPPEGTTLQFAVPPGTLDDLDLQLRDKVPFCYIIRMVDSIGNMSNRWGTSRSFYFDVEVPNAGTVRFDGSQVLDLQLGGIDMAQLFRTLITSVLCFGILLRAYKIVERQTGGL